MAVPGGPTDRLKSERTELWLLPAILLVAGAVRLVGLSWGLPYTIMHPDEPIILRLAEGMHWGSLNPGFFYYPTFFIYQSAVVRGVAEIFGGGDAAALWGSRLLVALYDLVTVVLLWRLGRRLAGAVVGLLAAGLYALHPAAVLHSHYAVTDIPMTALVTATVWLGVVAWQERSTRVAILAAAVAGLAVSTKYSAAAVVYVPLLVVFALASRRRWGTGRSVTAALAVPAVAGLFFVAASPYTVLDHEEFFGDLGFERELQATARAGLHVDPAETVPLVDRGLVANGVAIFEDQGPVGATLALIALVVVVVGFVRRARRGARAPAPTDEEGAARGSDQGTVETPPRPQRPPPGATVSPRGRDPGTWDLLGWTLVAGFAVLFYLQMAPSAISGQRYLLPVYPSLTLLTAAGVAWMARRASRPTVALLVLAGISAAQPVWNTAGTVSVLARPDSRLVAREWIVQNLPPDSVIAREQYAPPLHTSDGFRLVQPFSLTDLSLRAYCVEGVTHLVTSSRNAQRYFEDPGDERFYDERNWYRDLRESDARLLREFEGTEMGIHDPTIQVWRLFCPRDRTERVRRSGPR